MSDNPTRNALEWRVTDLERRVRMLEELQPEVVADRLSRLVGEVGDLKRDLTGEMRALKRAFWAVVLAILGGLLTFVLSALGGLLS